MTERWHPKVCRECDRSDEEAGRISARGLCRDCGERRQIENLAQLRAREGPYFRYWRRRGAAAYERLLADVRMASDTES